MSLLENLNKPIARGAAILTLFILTALLLGTPLHNSIENILLSKAKVHAQAHSFALTPIEEQGSTRFGSMTDVSLEKGSNFSRKDRIVTSDARIVAMRRFLMDYNSPMYPYAKSFIIHADEYGLDWRLAAAISGVESAFGTIPVRANNAWGWKGGSDGDFNAFDSWDHGIEVVTTRLALGYGTDMDPFDIEPIYCPPCGENPNHLWANGVVKFMNEIEMYLHGF